MTRVKTARVLLVLFAAIVLFSCSKPPSNPEATVIEDAVEINIASLIPEVPSYFTYTYKDRKINYIVIMVDGKVQSYFDACETCHPKKLGFRYEDGYLYCRACSEKYSVKDLETGHGNCYPVKLHGDRVGDKYIIAINSLIENIRLF
ncbi:Fe-S-containing protein [Nitrospirota bacterium]